MDLAFQGINNIAPALRTAKRGDRIIYHKGDGFSLLITKDRDVQLIRDIVSELYANKKCVPVQRKVNISRTSKDGRPLKTQHIFEYIAVFL